MALADELLDNISEEQFAEYMLVEENPHIVIDKDRNIILPERYKVIAAQGDHNMATYTFDCPRFSDGRDMSKMVVYINYIRSDGETGSYPADNVSIDAQDNNLMHFEWTPLLPATLEHGAFAFLVCVCRTEPDGNMKNHWSTRLCKDATISEGMDCHQNTIIDMYPDVITRILERLNVLEDGGTTSVQYTVQDLEEEQKVQARKNIEAADAKEVSKLSEEIDYLKNLDKYINIFDYVERRTDLYFNYISGCGDTDAGTNYIFFDVSKDTKYRAVGSCGGNPSTHAFVILRTHNNTYEVIAPTGGVYMYGFDFFVDASLYNRVYITYNATDNFEIYEVSDSPYFDYFTIFNDITNNLTWSKDYAYDYESKSIVADNGSIVANLFINGGRKIKISGGTGGNPSKLASVACVDKEGNICGTLKNGVYYVDNEYILPSEAVRVYFTFAYNNALMHKVQIERLVTINDALESSEWKNKSWISYGDSITKQEKWQKYINAKLGFNTFRNNGISGTCIANVGGNSFVSDTRLSSLNKTSDLIFIMGGTNDFGQSIPLGDLSYPFDETTFKGAIASLIVKLQNLMPNTEIVFGTQVSGDGGAVSGENITSIPKNNLGLTPEDYANAMVEVCGYMSIPCIDVYHNCGINPFNRATYISDTVHPNDNGGKKIAKVIANGLQNIIPLD